MGVRVWRKAWGMDDYLMLVGILLFSVTASLCIVCCFYGSGQLAKDLPPLAIQKGIKLFYIAEYFYAISAMFIKISVAVAILRIAAGRRPYEVGLWALIGATVVAAAVFCIGIANICHPINTLWGESKGTCNLQLNTNVSLFYSAIEIAADFSLSLLPAILLWNVQMKTRVKASVMVMLGLASFNPNEFLFGTGKIGFWSLTEEGIGIIAGSLPSLRPLLTLRIRVSVGSKTPASAGPSNSKSTRRPRGLPLDTFQTLGENDADNDDGDSQKNIMKVTKYVVTSAPAEGHSTKVSTFV
ncbi:cation-transporting atpase 4 [Pyrenophora seminiperda CCB06]|uniref:Cation-transporting atpase 4 n=1 Tax=Pyrenophora seminiperda CCB06 TaxID=1302712 RepID=A0A3M7MG21_9PLEO|nr:cation-transporting atpase 4 [Pyrenophora seminiperda CCB06]